MIVARKPVRVPIPKAAQSTAAPQLAILGGLPATLREELIDEFNKIERYFREGRWEPAELDGGRLCEIVYSIVRGHIDGSMPARASKPRDMVTACRELEKLPSSAGPRSIRVQIPRLLLGLYEIRNNRDVGHVGAEVSSNHMDASLVLATAKWLVAELVRIFHQVDTATAASFVDALVERETPIVWKIEGRKRVLNPKLSMKKRMLLLLHATPTAVQEHELCEWSEHPTLSVFRRDVLRPAHAAKLIEYDSRTHLVHLSPLGGRYVEANLADWAS